MRYLAQAFLLIVLLSYAQNSYADHALLDDGRVLYNVMVPDGATTGSAALTRIRVGSLSFGFDPKSNTVFRLPAHSVIYRIADYIESSATVGRAEATEIVQKRRWGNYTAPPQFAALVAPPPAPKAKPLPPGLAQETPVPLNVVPKSVPLDERLTKQLDLFMKEQTTLAQDATTSMARGIVSPQAATGQKVRLLQQQKNILEQFYPQTTDTVKLAVEYWGEQVNRAAQTGRFDLENL